MTPIAFKTSLSARPCLYDHSPLPVPARCSPPGLTPYTKFPRHALPHCALGCCSFSLACSSPPAWAPHYTVTAPQLACLPYQAPGWLRSSLGTLIGICHLSWEESPST